MLSKHVHMTSHCSEEPLDSDDKHDGMREMFGPQAVDQAIGHAVQTCWMMLPKDKRTPEKLAAEIRRIVERTLANLNEDVRAFGFSSDKGDQDT